MYFNWPSIWAYKDVIKKKTKKTNHQDNPRWFISSLTMARENPCLSKYFLIN